MTAPDPLYVRAFENQIKRHEGNARRDFASVQRNVQSIASNLEDLGPADVVMALGAARNLARDVGDLIASLSALATLKDVEFLVSGTEEKGA